MLKPGEITLDHLAHLPRIFNEGRSMSALQRYKAVEEARITYQKVKNGPWHLADYFVAGISESDGILVSKDIRYDDHRLDNPEFIKLEDIVVYSLSKL